MFKIFNFCLNFVKSVFSKEPVGTREEELNKLLKVSIEKKNIGNFQWALKQLQRKPSAKEIIAFIGDCSSSCVGRDDILSLLEMTEEKIPQEDLDRMINTFIDEKKYFIGAMAKMAYMGASQKACRRLFDDFLSRKELYYSVDIFLLLDTDEKEREDFFLSCKKSGDTSLLGYAKKKIFNEEISAGDAKETLESALTLPNIERCLWQISDAIKKFFKREITVEEVDSFVKAQMSEAESARDLLDVWTGAEKGCSVKASDQAMRDLAEYTAKKLVSLCEEKDFDSVENVLKQIDIFQRFPDLQEKDKVASMLVQESAMLMLKDRYSVGYALEMIESFTNISLPSETVDEIIRRLIKSRLSYSEETFASIASLGASKPIIEKLALNGKISPWSAKRLGVYDNIQKDLLSKRLRGGYSNASDLNGNLEAEEIYLVRKNLEKV